jgi:hypothetical protein
MSDTGDVLSPIMFTFEYEGHGFVYVGGTLHDRLSLHVLTDGKRQCQNARPADCRTRVLLRWRARLLPTP